jgi:hypothetical protein
MPYAQRVWLEAEERWLAAMPPNMQQPCNSCMAATDDVTICITAVVVYQMWLYRSVLLRLSPHHPSVPVQPDDYVPSGDNVDAVAPTP